MKKISMFIIQKTDYFQLCFLYKSDLRIFTAEKHKGIISIEHFHIIHSIHIIDQIKVLRVPLWIGLCHLCIEGY